MLPGLLALIQAIDWFGPKEYAYSLAIPATILGAYALLAWAASWTTRERRALAA
ncbi:hypothetical protein [Sphingopyxis flava]|uniref:Uncharacterized protein n=1 Tax=Sphingopyxis flava TaxID=1507287 RepID=A0A1T5DGC6_9SPHN|nr:hypothetical protein [Sphingopyxis flava]SKB70621.1 hypothetical protein SAMN06295937_101464 [Sphingopyxis flava]